MSSFVELLLILPLWAIFSMALLQAGRLVFLALQYPFESVMEEASFSYGLGVSLLGTAIWIAGLFSALHPATILTLSALVVGVWLVTWRSFWPWAVRCRHDLRLVFAPDNSFELFLIWIAGAAFLVTLLAVASPQLGRDALAYHLYCPKEFIRNGELVRIPYCVNALQPLLVQMLYSQGLAFKSEIFLKLYNVAFLIAMSAAMIAASRFLQQTSKGLIAGLLLMTATGIMAQVPYAYSDIALSFFLFLSLLALLKFFRDPKMIFVAVSGLFSGFALATKILAMPVVAAYFLLLIYQVFFCQRKDRFHAICVFAVFALLPCIGWYLRSFFATGNPVFPYFNQWFTGREWSSDIRDQTGIGRSLSSLVQAPILFFLRPESFGGGDSQMGILILMVAPLLALIRLGKGDKAKLLFLVAVQFLFWFYLVQHYRFVFPLAPVLYLTAGMALELVFRDRDRSWLPAKSLIVLAIALQAALIFYYNGKLSRYLLHPSKSAYLTAVERSYGSQAWANAHLDKNAYALLDNEPSQYYLDRASARLDIVLGLEPGLKKLEAPLLIAELGKKGFTHLAVRQVPGEQNAQVPFFSESMVSALSSQNKLRFLHEELFFYNGEKSRVRWYEITHG